MENLKNHPGKRQSKGTKNNPRIDLSGIQEDAKRNEQKAEENEAEITGEHLLLRKPEAIQFVINKLMHQTGLACLAGSSDTGKSTLLRQLAIFIVLGKPDFLGFKISPRFKSAIYVSTEDLEPETSFLLGKQAVGIAPKMLRNLRFIFSTESLREELHQRLTKAPADLVIIDCFSDAYGGDLKDTQKIRAYLQPFQELAGKHKCLILFLHHTGKRTENLEPSKNNLLSGQGFEAKMRLVLELRQDQNNPNHRHLCIVKGNYLSTAIKRDSYVLNFNEQQLLFSNTGERVPFDLLAKQEGDSAREKFCEAYKYVQEGLTQDEIAEKMGYAGKSAVSKILSKGKANGWEQIFDNGNTGNRKETKQKKKGFQFPNTVVRQRFQRGGRSRPFFIACKFHPTSQ